VDEATVAPAPEVKVIVIINLTGFLGSETLADKTKAVLALTPTREISFRGLVALHRHGRIEN
jgi:hypothetical protein